MRHIKYPRSSVLEQSGYPKTPASSSLDYGEIAINYADGLETISIKNSDNSIVKFTPNTNVFVKNFLTTITTNDVCSVLSVANVYNYQDFEISFLEAYSGNFDLSGIIEYIKDTFYNTSDINLMLNVVKSDDSNGSHTAFYINTEVMQDLMDDASKPISVKSSIFGFTKYNEYFIASDSTSMSGIEINWDHTTKAVTVRYAYMDNVYRMDGGDVEDESTTYFYIEDTSGAPNTLSIKKYAYYSYAPVDTAPSVTVYYSTDQVNWVSMGTTSATDISATVPANGRLYLKANTNRWSTHGAVSGKGTEYWYNAITVSGYHNAGGCVMSILNGDNFINTSLTSENNDGFGFLFCRDTKLVRANKIVMPNNVQSYSHTNMFRYCSSLIDVPVLPATTLVENCYMSMFGNCTSLVTPPVLPATTLASTCYGYMFISCTSMVTAPVLPATGLVYGCYRQMFQNCTNLNSVISYANNISASTCLTNWLSGVSATGDFYNLGSASYPSGVSGIPSGWTIHTSL